VILNPGGGTVDLANVKVHYYFTAEGDTSLKFECDYAGFPSGLSGFACGNVTGAFVSMGANATPFADTYLELSFASISLPNSGARINFRIHDSSYAVTYNQANDWSFFSYTGSMTYVDGLYVTAYLNGTLVWGTEPGALPVDAGLPPIDAGGGG
jgi:hypothetical protein